VYRYNYTSGDSSPICQPLRKVPLEGLVQMMEQGVIQHSNNLWASPVVWYIHCSYHFVWIIDD